MSDDIDIRSGGLISVDTESLRAAASDFRALARSADDAYDQVRQVGVELHNLARAETAVEAARVGAVAVAVSTIGPDANEIANWLERRATVYEVIELWAERTVASAADLGRIDARLAWIDQVDPDALTQAQTELGRWETGLRLPLLSSTALVSGFLGPPAQAMVMAGALGATAALEASGSGLVSAPPVGSAGPVTLTPISPAQVNTAPATFAEGARRIPYDDADVHIEKYTMPDGSLRYGVFITGTRSMVGDEVWNMDSNQRLFRGGTSVSYEATVQALQAAGAQPGDPLYIFGHSQGGMVGAFLALTGTYDTRMLVTYGSPVQAQLPADTLAVEFRHDADPVALLTGGGNPAHVGSADSVVISRNPHPIADLLRPSVESHQVTEYEQTAALADAATDPRMAPVRATLAELGAAVRVESIDFSADRARKSRTNGNRSGRNSAPRDSQVF